MSTKVLIQDLKDYAIVNDSLLVKKAALQLENCFKIFDIIPSFLQHKENCAAMNNTFFSEEKSDLCDCDLINILALAEIFEIYIPFRELGKKDKNEPVLL